MCTQVFAGDSHGLPDGVPGVPSLHLQLRGPVHGLLRVRLTLPRSHACCGDAAMTHFTFSLCRCYQLTLPNWGYIPVQAPAAKAFSQHTHTHTDTQIKKLPCALSAGGSASLGAVSLNGKLLRPDTDPRFFPELRSAALIQL